ncbi:general stress protein [Oxalobacteraceae bacterium OM1]|nr:general stress protein [Oxalobacteraceae bacterium OM1]
MDIQQQATEELQKIAELIGEIKFCMMTTEDDDGTLRSRPMSTLQMEADGTLWFFTSLSSPKIDEAQHHRHVNLSYARPDKQDYVSVSGTAAILRNPEKMQQLWTPWVKPWFPQGLADPDLVLIRVTMDEAEYWDAPGNVIKRFYGLSKGVVTGKTDALGENRKVIM